MAVFSFHSCGLSAAPHSCRLRTSYFRTPADFSLDWSWSLVSLAITRRDQPFNKRLLSDDNRQMAHDSNDLMTRETVIENQRV